MSSFRSYNLIDYITKFVHDCIIKCVQIVRFSCLSVYEALCSLELSFLNRPHHFEMSFFFFKLFSDPLKMQTGLKKKDTYVQYFKICLKKLWPNWDPNLRCLKLINMTIIKRHTELYLTEINKYCFTTGVLFRCVTAVLI